MTPKVRRDWKPIFLSTYRETGMVTIACQAAGISRVQAYRTRTENEDFRQRWADADEAATESLEAEARRRAMTASDVLLIFLLKSRRPTVYRENTRVELTGADGGPVELAAAWTDHERRQLRQVIEGVVQDEGTEVAGKLVTA